MEDLLLTVHSVWRWVVLPLAVAALALALLSAGGSRAWDAVSDRLSFFFVLAMDIQVVIGILLWVTGQRWQGDPVVGWLHPLAMLAAVGLAHLGRVRADRASGDATRGRQVAIYFVASLAITLAAIPLYSWPT
jgi:hypothetical protein